MIYPLNIKGFEGQRIEVETSFWAAPKLLLNGRPVQRGGKRNELVLRRNDGREVYALWKPHMFGMDLPQLIVDGKLVRIVPPLQWYEWLWSALPLILITIGGAFGALVGLIAFSINIKIFRIDLSGPLKFLATAIVSTISWSLFVLLASIFLASAG